MSPWKVILATLVIFCSGLVTGTLIVKKVAPAEPQVVPSAMAPAGSKPPLWHQQQKEQQKEFLHRIDKELTLTPEQREKIERIMKSSQDRTKVIRDKIAPELKDEVKKLREEIRVELTPDQQKKFDESIKAKQSKKGEKGEEKEGHRRKQTNAVPTQP